MGKGGKTLEYSSHGVTRENSIEWHEMNQARDHIFISYATEQRALCDWLARRLAAHGYAIWCDRQKLLGGENWPNDIDLAINERTFRMLALLSRASMNKPNPQGEWLKGFAIGKKLSIEDFVIPLNTEGLRPDEIKWNLQPINYISFSPSWAEGLDSLLKKLRSIDTPKVLKNGPRIAVESIVASGAVRREPEPLLSNCFEITQIPRFVRKYKLSSGRLSKDERRTLRKNWACRDISATRVFAFHDPPSSVIARYGFRCVLQEPWRDTELVDGIDTRDLVVNLIHKCLHRLLEAKGMLYCDVRKQWYLPRELLRNDRVFFNFPNGKKGWFKGVGERIYPAAKGKEVYRYHLSPSFALLHNQTDPFVLLLRNRVYLTDVNADPLDERKIVSRRKHLCKTWFNHEWSVRTLGIAQLISDGNGFIRFGPGGKQELVIQATPIVVNAPQSIRDDTADEPDEDYTTWYEEEDEDE